MGVSRRVIYTYMHHTASTLDTAFSDLAHSDKRGAELSVTHPTRPASTEFKLPPHSRALCSLSLSLSRAGGPDRSAERASVRPKGEGTHALRYSPRYGVFVAGTGCGRRNNRARAHFHSARSTSTTDLKANHSGISSPARSILRNLVPDSFITSMPFSFASSAVM